MSLPTAATETAREADTGEPKSFVELVYAHFGSGEESAQVLARFERRPFRLGNQLQIGEASTGINVTREIRLWDLKMRGPAQTDGLK